MVDASRLTRRAVLEGAAGTAAALTLPIPASAAITLQRDSLLWYTRPAATWTEALPVGTGRLGAMVFGGVERERLQLNEATLWTGGPYDPVAPGAREALDEVRRLVSAGDYAAAQALADKALIGRPRTQMAYQPLGDLFIELQGHDAGDVSAYRRELDLDSAVSTTFFRRCGGNFTREVFAAGGDELIALRIAADRSFDLAISLRSAQPGARTVPHGALLWLTGRNGARAGIAGALRFAAGAHVAADDGSVATDGSGLVVRSARAITVLIAMATSYRRFDDVSGDPEAACRATLDRAAGRSFEAIRADAIAAHQRLFHRVRLDLGRTASADQPTDERIRAGAAGDPALVKLYFDYGRYLLIASSQRGGQPANLQGIWNEAADPPWQSKYTVNINTQMNYWPTDVTALPECVAPLVEMVRDLAVSGARTARKMYGARGWVCHHNTDLWRATAPIDGAQWGLWPMGGAWLATHLWDHYDFARDLTYLRSVYPLMRGAALFFLDTLQDDPATGALVTNPSLSPENTHARGASLCAGPAMDNQILRDLFDQVARAATLLRTDRALVDELHAARARLAPDRVGAAGQLQEWREDWDMAAPEPQHRHVSHLYALFPSYQIDPDRTPALANAARRSLELRGDESTGWATAWRANLWARLRDGERTYRILAYLLGPERTYPNLFDAHPPFQIDGNFGGTRAIAEMLLQSRDDEILLLPALPRAWPAGSIAGLRARGAAVVDLSWGSGRLIEATVTAQDGGRRVIRHANTVREVMLQPGRPLQLRGPTLEIAPGAPASGKEITA
jgi:alpha-L-fucosidase 2